MELMSFHEPSSEEEVYSPQLAVQEFRSSGTADEERFNTEGTEEEHRERGARSGQSAENRNPRPSRKNGEWGVLMFIDRRRLMKAPRAQPKCLCHVS